MYKFTKESKLGCSKTSVVTHLYVDVTTKRGCQLLLGYDEEISLGLRYQRGPKLLPENVHSAEVVGGRERCCQRVEIVKRVCNLL